MVVIQADYAVEGDWTGGLHYSIKLNWEYSKGYVDISMLNYIQKQLTKCAYPSPKRKYHIPYATSSVVFGKAAQDLPPPDLSAPLGKGQIASRTSCWKFYLLWKGC